MHYDLKRMLQKNDAPCFVSLRQEGGKSRSEDPVAGGVYNQEREKCECVCVRICTVFVSL